MKIHITYIYVIALDKNVKTNAKCKFDKYQNEILNVKFKLASKRMPKMKKIVQDCQIIGIYLTDKFRSIILYVIFCYYISLVLNYHFYQFPQKIVTCP
jgi:hypothetical protein